MYTTLLRHINNAHAYDANISKHIAQHINPIRKHDQMKTHRNIATHTTIQKYCKIYSNCTNTYKKYTQTY